MPVRRLGSPRFDDATRISLSRYGILGWKRSRRQSKKRSGRVSSSYCPITASAAVIMSSARLLAHSTLVVNTVLPIRELTGMWTFKEIAGGGHMAPLKTHHASAATSGYPFDLHHKGIGL
jgi:hypothetical protein